MSDVRRSALITVASSEISTIYAEHLASRGYDLILVASRRQQLDVLADSIQREGRLVDIRTAYLSNLAELSSIEQLISEREDIDVLVNSAFSSEPDTINSAGTDNGWLASTSARTFRLLSLTAVAGFRRRGHGTLVNITSSLPLDASTTAASHSDANAFFVSFSRALQFEYANTDIIVQTVFPKPEKLQKRNLSNVLDHELGSGQIVGNRMLAVQRKQADKLLCEGASAQQIDAVVTRFGFSTGPFAMRDLVGLEAGWHARKIRGELHPIEDALCEAGRLGQQSGRGYYRYQPGSCLPILDSEVDRLVLDICSRLGVERRATTDEEILQRMLYPMINEGARIIEEGFVTSADDIDRIWRQGYGWPISWNGPMHYADEMELALVLERLWYMAAIDRDVSLRPAELLSRLARSGETFAFHQ